jgi:DNA-binding transcriptional ArsR family regulator
MTKYTIESGTERFLSVARAVADESRTRALMALRRQELCVCQIVELLGLAPSTVSKHMSILKQAGLVRLRKDGRWVYYRLVYREGDADVDEALTWLSRSLARDPVIREDTRRLKEILKISPEELCREQAAMR